MTRGASHIRIIALTGLAAVTILAGCENSIEPFSEQTRYYAIFGFLDADRDTQYVRIEPTRSNPELGPVDFDVESVNTLNLDSGETVVWSDSMIDLEGGRVGLMYFGQFRPRRGDSYRIQIRRSDGAVTSAVTTVPDVPALSVRRPDHTFGGALEQGLLFDGVVRQPERVVVNYGVTYDAIPSPIEVQLSYNVFGAPEGPGWRIIVRLTRDKSTVLERLSLTINDRVALNTLSVDLRLLSDDWPLEEPGIKETNVVNGFGFFGAAATHRATWILDSIYVRELGLVDEQDEGTGGQ